MRSLNINSAKTVLLKLNMKFLLEIGIKFVNNNGAEQLAMQ